MIRISTQHATLDFPLGETCLYNLLQKPLQFTIGTKTVKQGRLLLYKQTHFLLHLTLSNLVNKQHENFEIPIPFAVEEHNEDGIWYFDYRARNLTTNHAVSSLLIPRLDPSNFFNSILEISLIH